MKFEDYHILYIYSIEFYHIVVIYCFHLYQVSCLSGRHIFLNIIRSSTEKPFCLNKNSN